jgi:hypothetical protein
VPNYVGMRRLPLVLTAIVAAVSALPAQGAAAPVLDGKKVTTYAFKTAVSSPQQHVLAETVENPVDGEPTTSCVAPRCYAFPFDVKPAKGLNPKTPASVEISWTLPTSRFWLVLMDVSKKTPTEKARCSTFFVTGGTSAVVRVNSLKPGKYAAWVTVQQLAAPDTVSGVVAFPAKHTVAPHPGPAGTELFLNGCNA